MLFKARKHVTRRIIENRKFILSSSLFFLISSDHCLPFSLLCLYLYLSNKTLLIIWVKELMILFQESLLLKIENICKLLIPQEINFVMWDPSLPKTTVYTVPIHCGRECSWLNVAAFFISAFASNIYRHMKYNDGLWCLGNEVS